MAPSADGSVLELRPDHIIVARSSGPGPDIVGNLAWASPSPAWTRARAVGLGRSRQNDKPVSRRVLIVDDRGAAGRISLALQLRADGKVKHSTAAVRQGAKLGPFSANLAVPRIHTPPAW